MTKQKSKRSPILKPTERDFILVHLGFGVLAALALIFPLGLELGPRIFALLLIYNVAFPLLGRRLEHRRWTDIWTFTFPISVLQILPDWFLSRVLGALVFPDTGFPFIGTVPAFMALMWSIPFTVIVFTAWRLRRRLTDASVYLVVLLLTAVIFGTSEATLWMLPIWYATDEVWTILHIAVYVMCAELVLGVALWTAYRLVEPYGGLRKIVAAFAVMFIYTGALAVFYLLIEGPTAAWL